VLSLVAVAGNRRIKKELLSFSRLLTLIITLLFAVKYRFFTPMTQDPIVRFIGDPRWIYLAEYLLALLVMQFFLSAKKPMSATSPFLGLFCVCCAALSLSVGDSLVVIQLLGLLYVVFAALYCSASRLAILPGTTPYLNQRRFIILVVLALTATCGWVGGNYWSKYSYDLDQLLSKFQPSPGVVRRMLNLDTSSIGFSKNSELNDVSQIKLTDADKTALHVFSAHSPGYLRAQAFERYSASTWRTTATAQLIEPNVFTPEHLNIPGKANIFVLEDAKSKVWNVLDIWPSSDIESGMFAPLGTVVLEAPVGSLQLFQNGSFESDELVGGLNYVVAQPHSIAPLLLTDIQREECLSTPNYRFESSFRIKQLAQRIFENCQNPAQKIKAVKKYFHDNYSYHLGLQVPPGYGR
jgi:hypothetical protein